MRLSDLPNRINDLSGQILDAAIRVHSELGPGLLESTYKACLAKELELRGIQVEREVPMVVIYRGLIVEKGYSADFVVGGAIVVEAKTVETLVPVHEAQLMTYLKWRNKPLGILLNFHAGRIAKDGFRRRIHSQSLRESSAPPALRGDSEPPETG